ncbi:cell death-inducing p53-target protein 1 homolog [Chanos chanos]|uniref:Cell death-inducing p53-target protein 1 homolog n=1 Tax=Chanos chanos TaxID=29144 RepID=A0A6J2VUN0_CHACN|nr:cell death-inducing p53-target protein 1 homolog [Chanos chanos]
MAAPPSACLVEGPSVNKSDVDVKQKVGNINITIANPTPANQPQAAPPQQQVLPQMQPVYAPQPHFAAQPTSPVVYQHQPAPLFQAPPQNQVAAVYQAPPRNQVITTQPAVVYSNNLGSEPSLTVCRNCGRRVNTVVLYKNGSFTVLMFFVFLLFGCCCIPFCVDSFKDAHHSCPECHMNLHVHKRM